MEALARDGLVGQHEIAKPGRGGFLPIADSGGVDGLTTAGLAELRLGRGRMLLCQLGVTGRFAVNPVARQLLRNLLAYAAQRHPMPAVTGAVCDDRIAAILDRVGLRYSRLAVGVGAEQLEGLDVLLVCSPEMQALDDEALRRFVHTGGTVVLHGLTPGGIERARELWRVPLAVAANSGGAFRLVRRDGPVAGISNLELAWFAGKGHQGTTTPPLSPEIADHVLLLAAAPQDSDERAQWVAYTEPGLIASLSLGDGLWVIDQVRWERTDMSEGKGERYLAMLLTNLGCEFQT